MVCLNQPIVAQTLGSLLDVHNRPEFASKSQLASLLASFLISKQNPQMPSQAPLHCQPAGKASVHIQPSCYWPNCNKWEEYSEENFMVD